MVRFTVIYSVKGVLTELFNFICDCKTDKISSQIKTNPFSNATIPCYFPLSSLFCHIWEP